MWSDRTRVIGIEQMVNVGDTDFYREVRNCVRALSRINMEVLVLDTMHPQLRIPTFYTIVPRRPFP